MATLSTTLTSNNSSTPSPEAGNVSGLARKDIKEDVTVPLKKLTPTSAIVIPLPPSTVSKPQQIHQPHQQQQQDPIPLPSTHNSLVSSTEPPPVQRQTATAVVSPTTTATIVASPTTTTDGAASVPPPPPPPPPPRPVPAAMSSSCSLSSIPASRLAHLPFLNPDDACAAVSDWMGRSIFDPTPLRSSYSKNDQNIDGQQLSTSGSNSTQSNSTQSNSNTSNRAPKATALVCTCPNCGRRMGASRFAPHLEKCMGGRNARKASLDQSAYGHTLDNRSCMSDVPPGDGFIRQPRKQPSPPPLSPLDMPLLTDGNGGEVAVVGEDEGMGSADLKRSADGAALDVVSDVVVDVLRDGVELATSCYVCMQRACREEMMQCDSCDRVYHLWCTSPRLNHVPENVPWFCFECAHLVLDVVRVSGVDDAATTAAAAATAAVTDVSVDTLVKSLLVAEDAMADGNDSKKKSKSKSKKKSKGGAKTKRLVFGKSAMEKAKLGYVATDFKVIEYFCDVCMEAIVSDPNSDGGGGGDLVSRWRCLHCPNFDLCDACFRANKTDGLHKPKTHPMAQVQVPTLKALV